MLEYKHWFCLPNKTRTNFLLPHFLSLSLSLSLSLFIENVYTGSLLETLGMTRKLTNERCQGSLLSWQRFQNEANCCCSFKNMCWDGDGRGIEIKMGDKSTNKHDLTFSILYLCCYKTSGTLNMEKCSFTFNTKK